MPTHTNTAATSEPTAASEGRHPDEARPRPRSSPPGRRSRRRRSLTAGATLLTALVLGGCTGNAAWGPLTSSYNGTTRVQGSGLYYPDRGTYAASGMIVRDRANDGNNVYGRTRFAFWQYAGECKCHRFVTSRHKSTSEFANETRAETLYESLTWAGTRSRGQMYVCAQMGFPVPDNCSNSAYVTFDY